MMGGEGFKGVLKFFIPYFLVGFFIALSYKGLPWNEIEVHAVVVGVGACLFTSIAETRKLFYSGGDTENFYFVQPGLLFRAAFACAVVILNVGVALSIFIPVFLISNPINVSFGELAAAFLSAAFLSVSIYLILMLFVSLSTARAANIILTCLQIAMAIALLAVLQLSAGVGMGEWITRETTAAVLLGTAVILLFVVTPVPDALVRKLSFISAKPGPDLYQIAQVLKKPALIRDSEQEAGFMFFLSGILRDPAFRLSSIGIAATPIMVAIYWSLRNIPVVNLDIPIAILNPDLVAPIASLAVSGVLVHYFISQNVLSSRNFEAKWIFDVNGKFDPGKFVLGARKALLICVHIPMTIGVFLALVFTNSVAQAVVAAVTFYFLCHVAASWFSIMQRNLPFSLPFTRIGTVETLNLLFMLGYSLLVIIALYFCAGQPGRLLMLNLFAFILVGVLEFASAGIVNKRIKLGAR